MSHTTENQLKVSGQDLHLLASCAANLLKRRTSLLAIFEKLKVFKTSANRLPNASDNDYEESIEEDLWNVYFEDWRAIGYSKECPEVAHALATKVNVDDYQSLICSVEWEMEYQGYLLTELTITLSVVSSQLEILERMNLETQQMQHVHSNDHIQYLGRYRNNRPTTQPQPTPNTSRKSASSPASA